MPDSRELIVTGFHRSGTSFAMSLLHRAGLHVGDDLIGAFPSNPHGHFEDREIVEFHNHLLADNGVNWQVDAPLLPVVSDLRWGEMQRIIERRCAHHDLWGFKDPRASIFLPLWKHLLPDARVLVVHRPWQESVDSMQRRHADGLERSAGDMNAHRRVVDDPDLARRMWAVHNEALLRFADRYPEDVAVVSFDALQRGYPLTKVLDDRWGFGLEPVAPEELFDPSATTSTAMSPAADDDLTRRLNGIQAALRTLEARAGVVHGS